MIKYLRSRYTTAVQIRAPTVSVYKLFKAVYMGLCLHLFMGHLVNSKQTFINCLQWCEIKKGLEL